MEHQWYEYDGSYFCYNCRTFAGNAAERVAIERRGNCRHVVADEERVADKEREIAIAIAVLKAEIEQLERDEQFWRDRYKEVMGALTDVADIPIPAFGESLVPAIQLLAASRDEARADLDLISESAAETFDECHRLRAILATIQSHVSTGLRG